MHSSARWRRSNRTCKASPRPPAECKGDSNSDSNGASQPPPRTHDGIHPRSNPISRRGWLLRLKSRMSPMEASRERGIHHQQRQHHQQRIPGQRKVASRNHSCCRAASGPRSLRSVRSGSACHRTICAEPTVRGCSSGCSSPQCVPFTADRAGTAVQLEPLGTATPRAANAVDRTARKYSNVPAQPPAATTGSTLS